MIKQSFNRFVFKNIGGFQQMIHQFVGFYRKSVFKFIAMKMQPIFDQKLIVIVFAVYKSLIERFWRAIKQHRVCSCILYRVCRVIKNIILHQYIANKPIWRGPWSGNRNQIIT